MRGNHTVAGSLAVALVALGALTGCSDDGAQAARTPQQVAAGVLLDGGKPVEGVELELLVWPSPQVATADPKGESELVSVDTDTTDADGAFDLEALTDELSPHATGDGAVGLVLRRVGGEPWSVNTSVRLVRAPDTGITEIDAAEGMRIDLAKDAAAAGEEPAGDGD